MINDDIKKDNNKKFGVDEDKVIAAFHLMWGKFPEPVTLVHRSREILAVNEMAKQIGRMPGTKCSQIGTPASHRVCKANQALDNQQSQYAKYMKGDNSKKMAIAFWIPLAGRNDVYVHFSIGNIVDYENLILDPNSGTN